MLAHMQSVRLCRILESCCNIFISMIVANQKSVCQPFILHIGTYECEKTLMIQSPLCVHDFFTHLSSIIGYGPRWTVGACCGSEGRLDNYGLWGTSCLQVHDCLIMYRPFCLLPPQLWRHLIKLIESAVAV